VSGRRDVVTRRELLRRTAGTAAVFAGGGLIAACGSRAAHQYVAGGFFSTTPSPTNEDIVNETIRDLSYDWRELDPEETLRVFALRLADAKLITSKPQQIIAQGSDFAYMRQLRTELARYARVTRRVGS
jgi:NitT/TauT family transport system substrate-binding protein